jgi:hypothetical protein
VTQRLNAPSDGDHLFRVKTPVVPIGGNGVMLGIVACPPAILGALGQGVSNAAARHYGQPDARPPARLCLVKYARHRTSVPRLTFVELQYDLTIDDPMMDRQARVHQAEQNNKNLLRGALHRRKLCPSGLPHGMRSPLSG